MFTFVSQEMMHLHSECNLCAVHGFLLVPNGVCLGQLR